jgi:hypothetical protein
MNSNYVNPVIKPSALKSSGLPTPEELLLCSQDFNLNRAEGPQLIPWLHMHTEKRAKKSTGTQL